MIADDTSLRRAEMMQAARRLPASQQENHPPGRKTDCGQSGVLDSQPVGPRPEGFAAFVVETSANRSRPCLRKSLVKAGPNAVAPSGLACVRAN